MVSRRPDQTRTGAAVTWQGIDCVHRAPDGFRRPEPFHEDVSPSHGRNTQRLAAKSQNLKHAPPGKWRTTSATISSLDILRSVGRVDRSPTAALGLQIPYGSGSAGWHRLTTPPWALIAALSLPLRITAY